MTLEIVLMLLLTGAALVAFIKELFPIEVTALGLLGALLLTGLIDVETALTGFSSTAVIAIGSLFVLSHALTKTGLLETVADRLGERARHQPWPMIVLLLVAVSVGSGVLNNTAVVALSIPLAMKLCRRLELSPSKVLMPISYASILGGTLTLIGTSTNLLVSSLLEESGEPGLGVFELSGLGLVLAVAGMVYTVATARRLLPSRAAPGTLTQRYLKDGFLTELTVEPGSSLTDHNLSETHINERYNVIVLEVIRGPSETFLEDVGTVSLKAGDHLVVQGELEDILRLCREQGLALLPDVDLSDRRLSGKGQLLVEAWIAPGSQMNGTTLRQLDFHHRFGAFVLAVRRIGGTVSRRLADVKLRYADALLILLPGDRLEDLENDSDLKVLSEHDAHLRRHRLWWLILLVLPLVVLSAALGWMDIGGCALVGAIALLLARVLTPEEAYRSINWPVLLMIAAFVPVGHAFQETGTADLLARGLLTVSSWAPDHLAPTVMLAVLYLLTSVLTQVATNNAAAIVLAPIALSLGPSLGVDPRPFIVAVCFAASAAFMTPMGYQTNLMVYSAGEYRFGDYARFGGPLNLITWALSVLLIPVFWPF